jgi:hypothetical protein
MQDVIYLAQPFPMATFCLLRSVRAGLVTEAVLRVTFIATNKAV